MLERGYEFVITSSILIFGQIIDGGTQFSALFGIPGVHYMPDDVGISPILDAAILEAAEKTLERGEI